MKTSNSVSLKQLREEFPKYIEAIEKGQSFTVIKRSKPIFKIGPVADSGEWQSIADFTSVDSRGVPADDILSQL